jgi:hypothetical protein
MEVKARLVGKRFFMLDRSIGIQKQGRNSKQEYTLPHQQRKGRPSRGGIQWHVVFWGRLGSVFNPGFLGRRHLSRSKAAQYVAYL